MAVFTSDYTFRTPMRTIEFRAGNETVDVEVIAAAELTGAIAKDITDASDGPAKRSATRRTLNLKG